MYRVYGILRPNTDFTLNELVARLTARFPGGSLTQSGPQLTLSRGDWETEFRLEEGPLVRTETQGIVDKIAGLEQDEAAALISCERRIEVWSETPDPFMEYFNDHLAVIEVLKSFQGLTALDANDPAVL
jgi:hypothetical protein